MEKIIAFWEYAGERAIKTFAQVAVATITASQVIGFFDVNWSEILSVSALAAALSLLTSIALPSAEKKKEQTK